MRKNKLSIRKQMLLVMLPLVTIVILFIFYLQYVRASESLIDRQEEKKENIKEGVKMFIDNYDLSLTLIESALDDRIEFLFNEIIKKHGKSIVNTDLDSVKLGLGMDPVSEDIYIIDNNGLIINTTKEADLGLDFYSFGKTYENFLNKIRDSKTLFIERAGLGAIGKKPIKFAYKAIDQKFILEIGIQYASIDSVVANFNTKVEELKLRFNNIVSIDLFGGTEAFPSRNPNSIIKDEVRPLAMLCYETQIDTAFVDFVDGDEIRTDLLFIPIRGSTYYNGYVLQIVSNDALDKELLVTEFKHLFTTLLIVLLIVILFVYFFSKRITAPLNELVNKIADKQTNQLEPSTGMSSEVDYLGKEFNTLYSKLNNYYLDLETKIESRTTELKEKNKQLLKLSEERGLLIKEIHHRVKNNLQIISSLLNLQSQKVKSKEAVEAFENSKNRVVAMALLHEKLYKNSNFISINAYDYLFDLVESFNEISDNDVVIEVKQNDVILNCSESISIGLIANEAIVNSLKHGFKKGNKGLIEIDISQHGSEVVFTVFNSGESLPEKDVRKDSESLGFTIIEAFSEKLDGIFSIENVANGVLLKVVFTKEP